MNDQQIIKCENCSGNQVKKLVTVSDMMFLAILVACCIPVPGWYLIPIFMFIGFLDVKKGGFRYSCKGCKSNFRVTKEVNAAFTELFKTQKNMNEIR